MNDPLPGKTGFAALGFGRLVQVLRRARGASDANPLSPSERLEHRAITAILAAFIALLAYLVTPVLSGPPWLVAAFLYGAILLGGAGLALFAASGFVAGLGK